MARISPPFVLCPLSESKELLGISEDRHENRIIITIGRNIAIRYHVIEQKQEVSWTSSRHWLTSKVVYCSDLEKYGSVIDNNVVALWDEEDAHLASIKKYKFGEPILELRATKTLGTLVVFKSGVVRRLLLSKADRADHCNDDIIVDEKFDKIVDVSLDEKSSMMFIVCGNNTSEKPAFKCGAEKLKRLKVQALELGSPAVTSKLIQTTEVTQELEHDILGHCIITNGNGACLVYLRSDGYLYRRSLLLSKENFERAEPSKIAFISNYVSCSSPVVIRSLDDSTVVVYGCDASEEGATVFIFDMNYDLVLSKQSLKLFGSPPIMEKVGQNIFVPVGLNILVLGLRVTKSSLCAVLGRHQLRSTDFFETRQPWIKGWDEDDETGLLESGDGDVAVNTSYQDLVQLVNTLENSGQPQSMICSQVIPDVLEKRNFEALDWLLDYFTDIPEIDLIHTLTLLLSISDDGNKSSDKNDENEMEVSSENKLEIPIYLHHTKIDKILSRPFDQKLMIRSLRSMNFQGVKKLLLYTTDRLDRIWRLNLEEEEDRNQVSQLIKWMSALLDAQYPQFVFNNELDTIETVLALIEDKSKLMSVVETLEPLLTMTLAKTTFVPGPSPNSKYRTETVLFE